MPLSSCLKEPLDYDALVYGDYLVSASAQQSNYLDESDESLAGYLRCQEFIDQVFHLVGLHDILHCIFVAREYLFECFSVFVEAATARAGLRRQEQHVLDAALADVLLYVGVVTA